ncbi:MAG: hypothetical protein JSV86_12685 [Gemmatimonadota bacterium]|nr:MAG: hypothetical protein JSV86_12685 [Gemmatimonadota bacterium]
MMPEDLIRRARRLDGFAIPAAVFVIVVLTLLALSGLYIARSNATANVGVRLSLKALYAADAGATQVIGTWDRAQLLLLNPGDSVVTAWQTLPDGSQYRTSILRVDDDLSGSETLFRLRTVGRPGEGRTAQRVLVNMVRVVRADLMCCEAAIKLKGQLRVQGTGAGVKISGIDTPPTTWGPYCPADRTDIPGVSIQDSDALEILGTPILEGTPPVLEDTTIVSDDFVQFGELTYTDLARLAEKQIPGGQVLPDIAPIVAAGRCAEWEPTNWGDPGNPASPCWDYMPVIHVDGDLHISGNVYGQGILLVDGNLAVTGTFDFFGIVVVQGEADFRGTTSLNGSLLVRNGATSGEEASLRGGTTIQYSSCAAARALSMALVAQPLSGRNWFEVLE